MVEIPIVVVFGPSEDAFYVGAGRRFYVQNMPPSFTNAVHGSTLPVGRIGWVSLDKTGKYWCAGSRVSQNSAFGYIFECSTTFMTYIPTVYYVLQPKAPLRSKIVSAGCDFASFPDFDLLSSETLADQIEDGRSPYYFINHQPPGHWSLNLPTYYINVIQLLRETFKESGRGDEFDLRLRWILFGKGRTHVYQFDNGFIHCLEGPHADPKHLLNQVGPSHDILGFQVLILSLGPFSI